MGSGNHEAATPTLVVQRQAWQAHLLHKTPGRGEVNVVVGQQLGSGRCQVLDVLP